MIFNFFLASINISSNFWGLQTEQVSLRSRLELLVQENAALSGQLQGEISKSANAESIVKSLNSNLKQQLDSAIQVWQ